MSTLFDDLKDSKRIAALIRGLADPDEVPALEQAIQFSHHPRGAGAACTPAGEGLQPTAGAALMWFLPGLDDSLRGEGPQVPHRRWGVNQSAV